AAGTDPKLMDTRAEVWERAHTGCRTIVTAFLGAMAATDRQREQELIRLHTLVDGLATHPVRLRLPPPPPCTGSALSTAEFPPASGAARFSSSVVEAADRSSSSTARRA